MLAAHRDQENLAHEHQTVAAAKPLNQSVRGVAPKTPGNNEARTFNGKTGLKTGGRGDENATFTGKNINANKNAFITPLGPRERAPLGAKTTNAKAAAFQTPAPLTGAQGLQKTQKSSASTRKNKLKIHQPEIIEAELETADADEDDVPDIEYCPPKITELPDLPDDPNAFGPDDTFPQFQGTNISRGWYSLYCNPIGEDGLSEKEREAQKIFEQARARSEQEILDNIQRQAQALSALEEDSDTGPETYSKLKPTYKSSTGHPTRSKSSTLDAKSAAAALSTKPQPSYAAPTAAAKARVFSTHNLPKSAPIRRNISASSSTIGYSRGRKVSSGMKQGQPRREGPQKSAEGTQTVSGRMMQDQLMEQLTHQPGDHEDEELDALWRGQSSNLFLEEDCRPFVLQLPNYDE